MSDNQPSIDAEFKALTVGLDISDPADVQEQQSNLYSRSITADADTFVLDGQFAIHLTGNRLQTYVRLLHVLTNAVTNSAAIDSDRGDALRKGLAVFLDTTLSRDDFVTLVQAARIGRMLFHHEDVVQDREAFISAAQLVDQDFDCSTLFPALHAVLGLIIEDSSKHLDLY